MQEDALSYRQWESSISRKSESDRNGGSQNENLAILNKDEGTAGLLP